MAIGTKCRNSLSIKVLFQEYLHFFQENEDSSSSESEKSKEESENDSDDSDKVVKKADSKDDSDRSDDEEDKSDDSDTPKKSKQKSEKSSDSDESGSQIESDKERISAKKEDKNDSNRGRGDTATSVKTILHEIDDAAAQNLIDEIFSTKLHDDEDELSNKSDGKSEDTEEGVRFDLNVTETTYASLPIDTYESSSSSSQPSSSSSSSRPISGSQGTVSALARGSGPPQLTAPIHSLTLDGYLIKQGHFVKNWKKVSYFDFDFV